MRNAYAALERFDVHKLVVRSRREQTRTVTDGGRIDNQVQLIHQTRRYNLLRRLRTAVSDNVAIVVAFEITEDIRDATVR